MGQHIFAGVLCVIALAAGIWAWWVDNGGSFGKDAGKSIEESEKEG